MIKKLVLALIFYVIFAAATTSAQTQTALEFSGRVTADDLQGHIEAFLDLDGDWTIENIQDAPFRKVTIRGVDFGYTKGAIWLRTHLRNTSNATDNWRIHFRENFLPVINAYSVSPGISPKLINQTTTTSTFFDRLVIYPEVIIPLELGPGQETVLYVMYRSDGATQTSFGIHSAEDFTTFAAARTARNFVFYGMILFLTVAATLAFLITRHSVFAAYGFYTAAALIYMMHADGNAFQYIWPSAPVFNNYASILTGTGFIVTGANFARQFLQTKLRHPVMDRLLLGAMILAIGLVASTITGETQTVKKLLVLLGFLSILLFTASGLVSARTRFREVRFYVIAWTGALFASAVMMSRHWFGIDISEDTQLDAMRVVMVSDAAFMGLAILDRFNQLKQARQEVMKVSLDQAQRTLALSRRMQDLERKHDLATELAEARGRKLSDTVHDIRQPLHALRLNIQAMIGSPDQAVANIQDIEKTFAYLEDLVASELDMRAQNERVPEPHSPANAITDAVEVGEILIGVRDMFASDAAAKGIEISVVACSAHTTVPPLPLMRLVSNLVSNAVKFTPTGKVLVGVRRRSNGLRLEVHDTGPGLSETDFRQALGRSVRIGDEAQKIDGSGLGLAIVQEIVVSHGMRIGILPRQSPGTSIYVMLPAA